MVESVDRVLEATVSGPLRDTKTSPPSAYATVRMGDRSAPMLRITQLGVLVVAPFAKDEWERIKALGDAAFALYAKESP